MATIVLSGANRGIGLAHARAFAEQGHRLHALVRHPDHVSALRDIATQHPQVTLHAYDALEADSAGRIADALQGETVDLLFNNAGIMGGTEGQRLGALNYDTLQQVLKVNVEAPLRLSEALLPHMKKAERPVIANQSSKMGSIGDNGSGGYYASRTSKTALNMITKSRAEDLRGDGIMVASLQVG